MYGHLLRPDEPTRNTPLKEPSAANSSSPNAHKLFTPPCQNIDQLDLVHADDIKFKGNSQYFLLFMNRKNHSPRDSLEDQGGQRNIGEFPILFVPLACFVQDFNYMFS